MHIYHTPILAETIMEFLNINSNSVLADLTTGEGGHSSLMAALVPQGQLLCLDRDRIILEKAQERMEEYSNITYVCDTYDHLNAVREKINFPLFDGILIDMGISMFHFKGAERGFSFEDDSLDMRLSEDHPISAEQVINTFQEEDLADIFYYYGEERYSRRYAREIVNQRPFLSAKELADYLVKKIGRHGRTHPATKIFQALRIYVNEELEIAENMLKEIVDNLSVGGVLCILTFHSLEDRLVKNAFKSYVKKGLGELLIPKTLSPSFEEIKKNPAARSAKLRVFKKG